MRRRLLAGLLVGLAAACDDDTVVPPPDRIACVEGCAPVTALEAAYETLDFAAFAATLHPQYVFEPLPDVYRPLQPGAWDRTTEVDLHRRMLAPLTIPAGEPAVAPDLHLVSLQVEFTKLQSFVERPEYYLSGANPGGLDPARWKVFGASYSTSLAADTQGMTDYQAFGRADLVIAQDLTLSANAPGRLSLYRWREQPFPPDVTAGGAHTSDIESVHWIRFRNFYRLPGAEEVGWEVISTIDRLRAAYAARDYARYATLFHDEFRFILWPDPLNPTQPTDWSRVEELRIHRRMFDPANVPPSEPPVPLDLWLTAITITLAPAGPFQERPDYYQSPTNPDGLDVTRWKAWGAVYNTSVLWETQGQTDYQVTDGAYFVVAQDLARVAGEPGSMLVYRWEDLRTAAAKEAATWTALKRLYR